MFSLVVISKEDACKFANIYNYTIKVYSSDIDEYWPRWGIKGRLQPRQYL